MAKDDVTTAERLVAVVSGLEKELERLRGIASPQNVTEQSGATPSWAARWIATHGLIPRDIGHCGHAWYSPGDHPSSCFQRAMLPWPVFASLNKGSVSYSSDMVVRLYSTDEEAVEDLESAVGYMNSLGVEMDNPPCSQNILNRK